MLEKCSTALLITDVESFSDTYRQLACDIDVKLRIESEWNSMYRSDEDVIILGSKYLDRLNKAYVSKAVVILKSNESPAPYIKKGIEKFIFDYTNQYELILALFKKETLVLHSSSDDLKKIIKDSGLTSFCLGNYDFKFDMNRYKYKGKLIYLVDSQKRYLAEWLLNGYKDNRKRMLLCNMRKRFGADFLKDIDRFGRYKEEKNEQ